MDLGQIENYLNSQNQPSFRLKQIKEAFFKQGVSSFEEITNLPQSLREELASKFPWLLVKPVKTIGSLKEGAVKALLELPDGKKTESVLIVYRHWLSVCLSVSVGCPLNCRFCATGKMGFKRHLSAFEIIDQVTFWNQFLSPQGKRVSNLVFMGMGEPFLNWEKTRKAIGVANNQEGLNIGQRKIAISTAGIVPGIKEFTTLDSQVNLAISLHSAFQTKREEIMPVARKYPIDSLFEAASDYVAKTKRKLFFEYALINGFNDRDEDAREIKKLFKSPLFHLNLIALNPIPGKLDASSGLLAPSQNMVKFTKLLDKYKINYTVRRSMGEEIQAACGQLAGNEN